MLDDQRARLQARDEEHHALDQVDQEIPEEDALQPGRRADQPQPVPADVEPGGDGREHAGTARVLGRPIGEKRREDRQRDLDPRIADPAPQAKHQPADADPHTISPTTIAANVRGLAERKRRRRSRPRPRSDRG